MAERYVIDEETRHTTYKIESGCVSKTEMFLLITSSKKLVFKELSKVLTGVFKNLIILAGSVINSNVVKHIIKNHSRNKGSSSTTLYRKR